MERRLLLAFALVALLPALAGCSPAGSLSMDQIDDRELVDRASVYAPGDGPGEAPPDADADREAATIREAIDNGSATLTARSPPIDTDRTFRSDDGFYDLSSEEMGTESGFDVGIEIDYNASSVDGDVVAYEDLPAVDRRALEPALDRPREGREEGPDFGIGATYTESDANSSVLVPDQEYEAVRYEGDAYPIRVDSEEETLTVYRYEATQVAGSPEEYASQLKETYEFELTGLTDAQSSIVAEATNGSYYAESSDDDAFAAIVDRFRDHEAVRSDDTHGEWLVRYDGELFWAQLEYGAFAD